MKVRDVMTRNVATCRPTDMLNRAARLMWERDCGCVPVVDDAGTVCGILTDRDICMAAYTCGVEIDEIEVEKIASTVVHSCGPDDSLEGALAIMRANGVRRLPVQDAGTLVGLVSMSDFLTVLRCGERHGQRVDSPIALSVIEALVAISEPRHHERAAAGANGTAAASVNPFHRPEVTMKPSSNHHVVVWLDQHQARVFRLDGTTFDETTFREAHQHIHRHPHPKDGGNNHPNDAKVFFTEVARVLDASEEVLIVGPSLTKVHFMKFLEEHDPKLVPRVVGVQSVDHPTDGQVAALAREYFHGADRLAGRGP